VLILPIVFTKGCFVGQEVVIRVLHRGGSRVARRLVGVRLAQTASAGAKILSGSLEIGVLTSVANLPALGSIALGYAHRDFTTAGTSVQVDGQQAAVVGLPMA
jgi:folate-binding Fe-S cluster repair protein YgfZ